MINLFSPISPHLKFELNMKSASCDRENELAVLAKRIVELESDLQKIINVIGNKGFFTISDLAKIAISRNLSSPIIQPTNSVIQGVKVVNVNLLVQRNLSNQILLDI